MGGILIITVKSDMLRIISEIDRVRPCKPADGVRGQRASTLLQPQMPNHSLAKKTRVTNKLEKGFHCLLSLLILALVTCILLLGSTPPVDRDALTHHLAVPKLYLKHGGIYEIPNIVFSYYPMNLDLLYMIPLYFGNDIFPKYIHFAFALLTALLIFTYVKNRTSIAYGLFGMLFFLSLPVIVKLSTTIYVDLGLIFFSTAALIFLLQWLENDSKHRYLVFSAIFCGLCLGTKYNGLISFFLLTSFVPLYYIRVRRRHASGEALKAVQLLSSQFDAKQESLRAIGYGALFAIIALVVFSPWMMRNYLWTKNPIYPLYGSVFSFKPTAPASELVDQKTAGNREESAEENQSMTNFMVRRHVFQEPLWQILLIPVRIFFEGQDDNPKYFDGQLNPLLLLLPILAFIRLGSAVVPVKRDDWILLAFSVLFLLFAFFETDMRIRYIAPIIPPLVILSAHGLHRLISLSQILPSNVLRKTVVIAGFFSLAFLLSFNVAYVVEQFKSMRPQDYLLGKVSREQYIELCRPEYAVLQYANRHLPDNARILGLYLGNRSYYSDRDLFHGDQLLLNTVKQASSPEEVLTRIRNMGFTHIIINYNKFLEWYGRNLTSAEQKRLALFFRDSVTLLLSHDGYQLFKI